MLFKSIFITGFAAALLITNSAYANGLMVKDPYARAARPNAPTGAAFMTLMNHSDQDITLIGVSSDVAKRVELHTHIDNGEGVMKMSEIEGGITIPAGDMHMMKRGGDHVMMMGLKKFLVDGEKISVTFEFKDGGEMVVEIPVDNARKPKAGEAHDAHKSH
jgi:copper(I)-binding protein